jgi:hypothetical protein
MPPGAGEGADANKEKDKDSKDVSPFHPLSTSLQRANTNIAIETEAQMGASSTLPDWQEETTWPQRRFKTADCDAHSTLQAPITQTAPDQGPFVDGGGSRGDLSESAEGEGVEGRE